MPSVEASKQSRLHAWSVLQRLRVVLSELGNVAIPAPKQKKFNAEGEILEHALTKCFRARNDAIKSLCVLQAVRKNNGNSSRRVWVRAREQLREYFEVRPTVGIERQIRICRTR